MNLIDCYVERILGNPWEAYGKWWLSVDYYEPNERLSVTELMFSTKEEALAVKKGHHFLA